MDSADHLYEPPEPPDPTEETEADREAAWIERELYEQDSARWEREDERE
jgi:hypothetical protein